jgi:hypothetical protein
MHSPKERETPSLGGVLVSKSEAEQNADYGDAGKENDQ